MHVVLLKEKDVFSVILVYLKDLINILRWIYPLKSINNRQELYVGLRAL